MSQNIVLISVSMFHVVALIVVHMSPQQSVDQRDSSLDIHRDHHDYS
jgi:hypothetical protein